MLVKFENVIIVCFLLFISSFHLLIGSDDFEENILKFNLDNENNILMSNIGDDKILKGSLKGSLASSYGSFLAANISCDLLGRSYKGRGFSCGFSEVEDLNGYCYVNLPNKIDTFLTKWDCITTAGFDGDAVCIGKVSIVNGNGKFAGIIGFGEIEMPLAKSLTENNKKHPLKLKVKIKYPLDIKKN